MTLELVAGLAVGVLASLLFSWNNTGILASQLVVNRSITPRLFIVLVAAGFSLGGLATYNVYESMVSLSGRGLELSTTERGIIALLVLGLMFSFTVLRIPASVTHIIIGGWVGGSIALGLSVNVELLSIMVAAWLASPLIAMSVVYVVYLVVTKRLESYSLLRLTSLVKILSSLIVFLSSLSLGASGLGLICVIAGLPVSYALVFGFVAGVSAALLGYKLAVRSGYELIVLSPVASISSIAVSATTILALAWIGVPASLTHTVTGGNIGAGLAHEVHFFNVRRLYATISSWVLSGLLSVIIVYWVTLIVA